MSVENKCVVGWTMKYILTSMYIDTHLQRHSKYIQPWKLTIHTDTTLMNIQEQMAYPPGKHPPKKNYGKSTHVKAKWLIHLDLYMVNFNSYSMQHNYI